MMKLPPFIGRNPKRAIEQLDRNTGELIATWESTTQAHDALNISKDYIIDCLKSRRQEAGGYKWRYK